MNGQKVRNYLFVISIVGILFFLASATPVIFNFEEYFNVGYFKTNNDYRTVYSDGYGEINMDLELERFRDDRYYYYISCHFSSGSNVEIVGMKFINYSVVLAGSPLKTESFDIDPPTVQFAYSSSVRMNKYNTLVWRGSTEVQFISNSIVQNETIQFDLRLRMNFGAEDYYNIGLISYVVLFLWIMAFPIGPILLKAIFQPNFRAHLDEETRKKHKKYLDYFKKAEDDQA